MKTPFLLCIALLVPAAHSQTKPIEGVIDIHVHAAPDSSPRSIDQVSKTNPAQLLSLNDHKMGCPSSHL